MRVSFKWLWIFAACVLTTGIVYAAWLNPNDGLLDDGNKIKNKAQRPDSITPLPKPEEMKTLCSQVVGVKDLASGSSSNFILDKQLYQYQVAELPQVKFWRLLMNTSEDSCLVNFHHNRTIIQKLKVSDWNALGDSAKKSTRDSMRLAYKQDSSSRVLITGGKRFFYAFDKAFLNFDKGITCFVANGVDPWYAQAILLIESPNKLQKSNAGAYGSFQLMKDVARMFGLKVNRQIDERADFERSAYAASSLIKKVCIPKAHSILDSLGIREQPENELWFRLLIMHVYHAGAGNVRNALFTFQPQQGNMDLIYKLWQAETRHFKSASQNYSQLVLAAMLEMNDRLNAKQLLHAHPLNLQH